MAFHPSQLEAIQHIEGPMMVLAGPGSGKTTVITQRVRYLTENCRISPSDILVVTFTKAAAREMEERFGRLMEKGGGRVRNLSLHIFYHFKIRISFSSLKCHTRGAEASAHEGIGG